MTYEEAIQKSFTIKWKVETCHQGESCWCRTINTITPIFFKHKEKWDEEEYYVVGSGELNKEMAKYFVKLHNKQILNQNKTRVFGESDDKQFWSDKPNQITMGWKSTVDITREQAISLATKELAKKIGEIHTMSDTQLEDYLEDLGYGETQGMEYFGNNFRIVD